MRLIDGDTAAAFAENCGATFVAKKLRDSTAFPEVVVRCKGCKHSWEDIGGLCCGYGAARRLHCAGRFLLRIRKAEGGISDGTDIL